MKAEAIDAMLEFAFDKGREYEVMKRRATSDTALISELQRELAELRMATATREVEAPF